MRKQAKNNKNFASRETAPLTIKSKSGLSAEDVAVLRSKTQKPVYRRQPSCAVSDYDCSSLAIARFFTTFVKSWFKLNMSTYVVPARLVGGGAL